MQPPQQDQPYATAPRRFETRTCPGTGSPATRARPRWATASARARTGTTITTSGQDSSDERARQSRKITPRARPRAFRRTRRARLRRRVADRHGKALPTRFTLSSSLGVRPSWRRPAERPSPGRTALTAGAREPRCGSRHNAAHDDILDRGHSGLGPCCRPHGRRTRTALTRGHRRLPRCTRRTVPLPRRRGGSPAAASRDGRRAPQDGACQAALGLGSTRSRVTLRRHRPAAPMRCRPALQDGRHTGLTGACGRGRQPMVPLASRAAPWGSGRWSAGRGGRTARAVAASRSPFPVVLARSPTKR
jgi:hypothetical protein